MRNFSLAGVPCRWIAALVAVFALGTGTAGFAQAPATAPKTMLALPPAPLLPATLGKLQRVAEGDAGDGLGQVDAADAAVLSEDGLKRFARSDYSTDGKPGQQSNHGTITVYHFGDASGAVAAYDYFRKPGMRPEQVGDAAVANGDELLLRSGTNVVVGHFRLDHSAMIGLTKELIDHLPKVSGPAALAPLLPTLLPSEKLDADSVKYALGPADYQATGGVLPAQSVGFDKSAETVTARYKGEGTLTLLLYPTPQIAGEHGRLIDGDLKKDAAAAGTERIRREGPLLVLTTGAWRPSDAQTMVDGVHLRSELSFDKPMPLEFHAEVAKTYSLLTSIAIFCGIGALAAIVLGLFFGGGRALIRIMQGKPAASEPEFLRIDLRGPGGEG